MNRQAKGASVPYHSDDMRKAQLPWVIPALAVSVVGTEIVFYPQIASLLFKILSGRPGWDGGALPYVQVFYALPVGIALLGAVLIGARLLEKRRPALLKAFLLGAVGADLLLLVLSVAWYASQVRL
jgi:uncharacterized membrane protein YfcA